MNKISIYVIKNVYFFQAGLGILANAFLLLFHIFTIHQDHRTKPNDVPTCHLAFVHIAMLLTTLDTLSLDIFKSLHFANDLPCKVSFYLIRVTRGFSICTTCLLSVIRVITISPSTFYFSRFKNELTKYIICAFFCVWSLNLSFNSYMIIFTVARSNMSNLLNSNKCCSLPSMKPIIMKIFFTLAVFQNVFFIAGMLLSSAYMVIFLSSHQKRSWYLQGMKVLSTRRAIQTVLLLVSFFVIVYCLDIIISSSSAILSKYDPVVLDVQRLVGNFYATITPFVFISTDEE